MQAMPICLRLLRHFVWRAFPLARARAGRSSEARMAIMAMTTNSSISVKARRSAHGGGWSCIAAQSPPKPLYFVKYNEPASSGLKQRAKLAPRGFDSGTTLLLHTSLKLQRFAAARRHSGAAALFGAASGHYQRLAQAGIRGSSTRV